MTASIASDAGKTLPPDLVSRADQVQMDQPSAIMTASRGFLSVPGVESYDQYATLSRSSMISMKLLKMFQKNHSEAVMHTTHLET